MVWRLWLQGDMVIKVVSVLLLLMSIVSWYVIVTLAQQAFEVRASAKVMGDLAHKVLINYSNLKKPK
ncbi:MAG: hypothetical protein IPI79_15345 [Moraxellaceae bacterium]|nr:hypothetical protein [Moraxellaceae bacterium]